MSQHTKGETEIGSRYHVEQSFPCGCAIRHYTNLYSLDTSYGIHYCPKHKSAPDLYEALKAMNSGSFLDPENPERVWERATPSQEAILKAFKALAKADGVQRLASQEEI